MRVPHVTLQTVFVLGHVIAALALDVRVELPLVVEQLGGVLKHALALRARKGGRSVTSCFVLREAVALDVALTLLTLFATPALWVVGGHVTLEFVEDVTVEVAVRAQVDVMMRQVLAETHTVLATIHTSRVRARVRLVLLLAVRHVYKCRHRMCG